MKLSQKCTKTTDIILESAQKLFEAILNSSQKPTDIILRSAPKISEAIIKVNKNL